MQSRQQLRAKHALNAIQRLQGAGEHSKIKSRTSEMPFMIHTVGLGQALAFFASKGKNDGYDTVLEMLDKWLREKGCPFEDNKLSALAAITSCDLQTYRIAQVEAVQYMEWAKKFASAYLTKDKESESR
jgi:CRISPR-associated protein Cmr5